MSAIREASIALVNGRDLSPAVVETVVGTIMDGQATAVEIAAFLTALRIKGETAEELTAAARAVRARAVRVNVPGLLVDTCGTGGDGLGTFNVSTAASFVVAAAGLHVAKHGNRASSGKVGAADVLEAAGARIEMGPELAAEAIETIGICFLFAPLYHPAFRHVANVRRELGFRTLFNLTGPLCNPAGATRQVVGLFEADALEVVAQALTSLGAEHAMVVHGEDGADEITATGPTSVVEIRFGTIRRYRLEPGEFGVARCSAEALHGGGDARESARILRAVLGGEPGARADTVALNAGAGLYVGGHCSRLDKGVAEARRILASGAALSKLENFVAFTNR